MNIADDQNRPYLRVEVPEGWRLCHIEYSTPNLSLQDGTTGTFLFLARYGKPFKKMLTAALADFRAYLTQHPERRPDYKVNWGDFIGDCPCEIWLRHGLYPTGITKSEEISVDHDEVLIDPAELLTPEAGREWHPTIRM